MLFIFSVLIGLYSLYLISTGSHVTGSLLLITALICAVRFTYVARRILRTQIQADAAQSQEPAPRQDERPGPHEIHQPAPHVTADAGERQARMNGPATGTPTTELMTSSMDMLRALADEIATGKATRPPPSVYDRAAEAGALTVRNALARVTREDGDVEGMRRIAETIFCHGFNQHLEEENVDFQSRESCAEMELAIMTWKSRNPDLFQ